MAWTDYESLKSSRRKQGILVDDTDTALYGDVIPSMSPEELSWFSGKTPDEKNKYAAWRRGAVQGDQKGIYEMMSTEKTYTPPITRIMNGLFENVAQVLSEPLPGMEGSKWTTPFDIPSVQPVTPKPNAIPKPNISGELVAQANVADPNKFTVDGEVVNPVLDKYLAVMKRMSDINQASKTQGRTVEDFIAKGGTFTREMLDASENRTAGVATILDPKTGQIKVITRDGIMIDPNLKENAILKGIPQLRTSGLADNELRAGAPVPKTLSKDIDYAAMYERYKAGKPMGDLELAKRNNLYLGEKTKMDAARAYQTKLEQMKGTPPAPPSRRGQMLQIAQDKLEQGAQRISLTERAINNRFEIDLRKMQAAKDAKGIDNFAKDYSEALVGNYIREGLKNKDQDAQEMMDDTTGTLKNTMIATFRDAFRNEALTSYVKSARKKGLSLSDINDILTTKRDDIISQYDMSKKNNGSKSDKTIVVTPPEEDEENQE